MAAIRETAARPKARNSLPTAVAVDSKGNIYIADSSNQAARKVTATTGIITTVAGNGAFCIPYGGDGGPATSAGLCNPQGVSVDQSGNLYVSDTASERIREVMAASLPPSTQTAAPTFSLQPGTYASPQSVTVSDTTPGAAIYVTLDGRAVSTVSPGYNGPINVSGTVTVKAVAAAPGYLPSSPVSAIYTITSPPASILSTVAGNGVYGFSGNGGPATSAEVGYPSAVAVDQAGNLFFADTANYVVWMRSATTGLISVVAGNGTQGYSGDGGQATSAELNTPAGIAVDTMGNLYIADSGIDTVRKVVLSTGVISTYAGVLDQPGYGATYGDGGPATAANLAEPAGLSVDAAANLYIADSGHETVREVAAGTGIIKTVAGIAGSQSAGFSGDGGPATSAQLFYPKALALDSAANLYIADTYGGRVRKVTASTGIINTVAGNGDEAGDSGDGGQATKAEVYPTGVAVDAAGDIYIASSTGSVRQVNAATEIISRVAGNGYYGYSGDGGSATLGELDYPQGLAIDSAGSL